MIDRLAAFAILPLVISILPARVGAADWDREPIRYSTAPTRNAITRLEEKISAGKIQFKAEGESGYLKSLLQALDVPVSSQMFVFSKTSLQRHRIGPETPRALYFNDDVYVGYCQGGDVLEISAVDPNLGTVFYTVNQSPGNPKILRHTEGCLLCHGSSHTRGVPGHIVRSVMPDRDGEPSIGLSSFKTDHSSPFKERWGGWYVTGTHGKMNHRGNQMTSEKGTEPEPPTGQNLTELTGFFKLKPYLSPHSDLVALMVMEHQSGMHNRLAQAAIEGRIALHKKDEGMERVVRELGDEILSHLLFLGESKLTDTVRGTSAFSVDFAKRGPFDSKGRSLRELDLNTRLFKYPCSYLIYSDAFQKMPKPIREHVLKKLHGILIAVENSSEYVHLSATDRRAIREILSDTLQDKPDYWK